MERRASKERTDFTNGCMPRAMNYASKEAMVTIESVTQTDLITAIRVAISLLLTIALKCTGDREPPHYIWHTKTGSMHFIINISEKCMPASERKVAGCKCILLSIKIYLASRFVSTVSILFYYSITQSMRALESTFNWRNCVWIKRWNGIYLFLARRSHGVKTVRRILMMAYGVIFTFPFTFSRCIGQHRKPRIACCPTNRVYRVVYLPVSRTQPTGAHPKAVLLCTTATVRLNGAPRTPTLQINFVITKSKCKNVLLMSEQRRNIHCIQTAKWTQTIT